MKAGEEALEKSTAQLALREKAIEDREKKISDSNDDDPPTTGEELTAPDGDGDVDYGLNLTANDDVEGNPDQSDEILTQVMITIVY